MSLKNKYTLTVTGIMLVLLGAFGYFDLAFEEKQAREYDRSRAVLVAEIIKNGLITIMIEGRPEELPMFIDTMVAEDLRAVSLVACDGRVIASSVPSMKGTIVNDDTKNLKTAELSIAKEGNVPVYKVRVPFFNERSCSRCHSEKSNVMCVLNVTLDMEKSQKVIRSLREGAVLNFLAALLIVAISSGLITAGYVTLPLKRIIGTIKSAEAGNRDAHSGVRRNDEIGELAQSLNSMLASFRRREEDVGAPQMDAMQNVEKMANLGELASAIAHEIKNPLAGISGAIQVIAEDLKEDDRRREIITEVLSEIERLDKTIRDLLSFAKPPEPNFVQTPIAELIERTTKLIVAQAKKQGLDVKIVIEGDHVDINTDPDQMQQVFLNIMINALHAMPGGGTITVSTSAMREEKKVVVSIGDTGSGIAGEDMEKIFKPFFTTKLSGTGLGLAICKNIVERHGGTISVESRVGLGSTFMVSLPMEA